MAAPSQHDTDNRADQLRAEMVENVIGSRNEVGRVIAPAVRKALAAVPRHLFCPGASLEDAYKDDIVRYEADERGRSTSTVSAPSVIATMLDQAELAPGQRVLEIGSGGYNAALIAELVGPSGAVVSVDIDPGVIDRARVSLDKAGYSGVQVYCVDGADGFGEAGPYDRIIVTVTAADIPPAWREQLKTDGAIIAPLRVRSLTRTVRFEQAGDRFVSTGYDQAGFVAGQGGLGLDERAVFLDDEGSGLRVDSRQPIETEPLRAAVTTEPVTAWTGVHLTPLDLWNDLELYIAAVAQNTAYLKAAAQVRKSGRLNTIVGLGSIAVYTADSIAFLTLRPKPEVPDTEQTGPDQYEIGARAHGPDAAALTEHLDAIVRDWDRHVRDVPARFTLWPRDASSTRLPAGLHEERPCSRITVDWPDARETGR